MRLLLLSLLLITACGESAPEPGSEPTPAATPTPAPSLPGAVDVPTSSVRHGSDPLVVDADGAFACPEAWLPAQDEPPSAPPVRSPA